MLQMLKRPLLTGLPNSIRKWNFSTGAHLRNKLEDMFNKAYKEYKAKRTGGGFFEPSEKILKELETAQKDLLAKYNAKTESEIAVFPKFDFAQPKIDPILEEPKGCKYCDELGAPKGPMGTAGAAGTAGTAAKPGTAGTPATAAKPGTAGTPATAAKPGTAGTAATAKKEEKKPDAGDGKKDPKKK